jgi:hypothetical protein
MKRLHKFAAIGLVLAMPVTYASASVAAAMLRSSGGVSVNGNPATTAITTVFAGDRIETAPKAVGNISFNGSSMLLDENSSVLFSGQDLNFTCGGGTLKTAQGTSAVYGRYVVKPAKDSARFQVQQTGATLRVSALEGDVTLSDGAKNFNLPAGNSMNVPYTGCVQMAKAETSNTMGNANPQTTTQTPQPDPTPTPEGSTAGAAAVVVAPAIVLSVALAAILAVAQTPVSPGGP